MRSVMVMPIGRSGATAHGLFQARLELLILCDVKDVAFRAAAAVEFALDLAFGGPVVDVYVENDALDLGLSVLGPELTYDRTKLVGYLSSASVPVYNGDRNPMDRWGSAQRAPVMPGLVGLVRAPDPQVSTEPADSYDLSGTNGLPPVVGVQLGSDLLHVGDDDEPGRLWLKVFMRAVAQLGFGLLDEFERPGAEFERPPPAWEGTSFQNVVFIDDTQRAALSANPPQTTADVLGDAIAHWPVDDNKHLTFTRHQGPEANVNNTAAPLATAAHTEWAQDLALYEGAAGYRTRALRGAADCLMRRMPASKDLPVQAAGVGLCPVCLALVKEATPAVHHTRLDNQRVEFDRCDWSNGPLNRLTGTAVKGYAATQSGVGDPPHWGARVEVTAKGLVLSDVRLTSRPDDPFVNSPDIFKELAFEGLTVTLAGSQPQTLDVADALDAGGDLVPELVIRHGGTRSPAQLGFRLTLGWDLPSGWRIDAVMAIVLMRRETNVDPGKGVTGCKVYPQLALRARRRPGHHGSLPMVEALTGTVVQRLNNVVAAADHAAMMDAGMNHGPRMTDAIDASLFADGNDLHGDAASYRLSSLVLPGGLLPVLPLPLPLRYEMQWVSFRRIAAYRRSAAPC